MFLYRFRKKCRKIKFFFLSLYRFIRLKYKKFSEAIGHNGQWDKSENQIIQKHWSFECVNSAVAGVFSVTSPKPYRECDHNCEGCTKEFLDGEYEEGEYDDG